MRFKVDENMPKEVRDDLRALGHDAETVTDEGMSGVPDAALLAKVQAEARVFLTLDKGIANRSFSAANNRAYGGPFLL